MRYIINPYLIYETKKQTIIQTREKSLASKNTSLIRFLKYLEEKNIEEFDEKDLKNIFSSEDNLNNSVDFLLNVGIIERKTKKYIDNNNRINILTNDKELISLINLFWKKRNITITNITELDRLNKNSALNIICLNSFNLKILKKIVKKTREVNNRSIYKIIFPYNHSIYISNYYSPSWGNPCPLCYFYSIESYLRGQQIDKRNLNFQTMVDLLYREQGAYEYDGLLQREDWIPILHYMNKEFKKRNEKILMETDDTLKIELSDYSINQDTCYYWEMCDCYE